MIQLFSFLPECNHDNTFERYKTYEIINSIPYDLKSDNMIPTVSQKSIAFFETSHKLFITANISSFRNLLAFTPRIKSR